MEKIRTYWLTAGTLSEGGMGRFFLFCTLLSIPLRKKIMSRRPYKIRLCYQKNYFDFYVRDSADIAALTEVFVDLEYATDLSSVPKRIVDLGSHVGTSVAYFALRYPESSIVAYEADPDNFAVLLSNTIQFPNISCVHAAVAPRGDTVTFFKQESSISSSLLDRGVGKALVVPAVLLNDILDEPTDFVKFDIEGAEFDVFAATPNLRRCPTYIGEVHYDLMQKSKEEFFKLLEGFTIQERMLNSKRSIVLAR